MTVSNGTAAMTTTLALGSHSLSAVFTPTNPVAFSGSSSPAMSYTVNPAPTTTTLTVTSTNPLFGHPVTLKATVAPSVPSSLSLTGTVSFTDGSTPLASVPISGGQASFTTSGLQPGAHSITAHYSGDANFLASTSTPTTVTVGFSQPCLTGLQILPLTVTNSQSLCVASGATVAVVPDELGVLVGVGDDDFQVSAATSACPGGAVGNENAAQQACMP